MSVGECLLVGEAVTLLELLERAGIGCMSVARVAEVEQALRTSRSVLVIVGESACEPGVLARLHAAYPERTLLGWQSSSSTMRAAELLEAGCVDVLNRTMGVRELLARVRNASALQPPRRLELLKRGRLTVDAAHGVASWDGCNLGLTRRERELLEVLVEAAPATVRREALYRTVWGYAMARGDRTVDVNVRRLRAKLGAITDDVAVATEPGVGYRLELREAELAVTVL